MTGSPTILDATAGNRMQWKVKEHPKIIFIDIEPELEVPPDRVLDCRKTDFPDQSLIGIFFDPPHWWGDEPASTVFTIRNDDDRRLIKKRYPNYDIHGSYFGTDKYQSKAELLKFIHLAQKEFSRILRNDGMLWLKWHEFKIPLYKILPLFKNWLEMMRFQVNSPLQTIGNSGAYWLMFMKKEGPQILDLSAFCEKSEVKK